MMRSTVITMLVGLSVLFAVAAHATAHHKPNQKDKGKSEEVILVEPDRSGKEKNKGKDREDPSLVVTDDPDAAIQSSGQGQGGRKKTPTPVPTPIPTPTAIPPTPTPAPPSSHRVLVPIYNYTDPASNWEGHILSHINYANSLLNSRGYDFSYVRMPHLSYAECAAQPVVGVKICYEQRSSPTASSGERRYVDNGDGNWVLDNDISLFDGGGEHTICHEMGHVVASLAHQYGQANTCMNVDNWDINGVRTTWYTPEEIAILDAFFPANPPPSAGVQ